MEQQQNGKRSWALPITLVLLVFSLMGNILLYTKHIEHTRGDIVRTGEMIFQGFKEGQEQLAHWSVYLEEIQLNADTEPALARLTAKHFNVSVDREQAGLAVLMSHAAEIDSAAFSQDSETYDAYEKKLQQALQDIGSGSGALSEAEHAAVSEAQSSFVSLTELMSAFHYEMEGDRNSMVRLANGHDWIDIASELQKALKNYAGS
ncbi:hypothetical protein D3P07_06515 [Paenibacillus sp. 1011MAR3C5]|uniref:hypothetical protein n=1 Tax=Paenibacillus sp. 1011MAR3C5 TaxID=1675787 RepID=UPI000E6C0EA6|nr:hypothetical protein [Paenibacillus sp. 1011MAR3C5]RJE89875.1 hypothetical protein D3P07_06515 [Paenibacillus sp. 1011MAR3C5]